MTMRVTDAVGDTFEVLAPIAVSIEDGGPVEPPDTGEPPKLGPDPIPVPESGKFDIQLKSEGGEFLWIARYYRELSSGFSWKDGDRDGYRGAYMHGGHPDFTNEATGDTLTRVLFLGGYGEGGATMVQDREMNEAERWYDGTVYDGDNRELNDCPRLDGHGPYDDPELDERVEIRWYVKATGEVLEKRQYVTPLSLADDVRFRILDHITEPFTDDRGLVTAPHRVFSEVVVGSTKDGVEMVNTYYSTLDERIGMDVKYVPAGAAAG